MRYMRSAAALAALGLGASACSLVVATNSKSQAAGCNVNADCLARSNGDPQICKHDPTNGNYCVALKSAECTALMGNWADDNAVIFGSILSTSAISMGNDASAAGDACQNAVQMAVDEFSQSGLPPSSASSSKQRRPLAFIGCSDGNTQAHGEAAADHLIDIGVPGIIGAEWSGITVAMAVKHTIPKHVLLISPGATSVGISTIADEDLLWRTSPSDVYQAAATVQYLAYMEPNLAPKKQTPPKDIKVAVIYKGDAYGTNIYDAISNNPNFAFNGKSATSNGTNYQALNYGDPSATPKPTTNYAPAVALVNSMKPDVVILLGTNEGIDQILIPVETNWSGGARPHWILGDGGYQPQLIAFAQNNADLRSRVTGTVPGTTNPLFGSFKAKYDSYFNGSMTSADVFGVAGSYDSVYLLAYAATAAQHANNGVIDGAGLAYGLRKLIPPATTQVPVGINDISSTLTTLSSGGSVDLVGASGALDFDGHGEAPSDIQIWCLPGGSSGKFSGIFLDAHVNPPVLDTGTVDHACIGF